MLPIGGRAPEFTLPDQDDQNVSLSTLLRHGPLILYFYPADFTPGCTREACSSVTCTRNCLQSGLDVAGVSPQHPDSHRRFREKYKLPFTLLADVDKFVIRMYDVLGPAGFRRTPRNLPHRPGALHPRSGTGGLSASGSTANSSAARSALSAGAGRRERAGQRAD